MNLIKISDNLFLRGNEFLVDENDGTKPSIELVPEILKYIDTSLRNKAGRDKMPRCEIIRLECNPQTITLPDGMQLITLSTKNTYWCQWIYQFAHECCHRVICQEPRTPLAGVEWFEEILCELSSQFHLLRFVGLFQKSKDPGLREYAPVIQGYLKDRFGMRKDLQDDFYTKGILPWEEMLSSEGKYHREYDTAVATQLLPLFEEYPKTWGILSLIGDTTRYDNLEDMFRQLVQSPRCQCRDEMLRLRDFLFRK